MKLLSKVFSVYKAASKYLQYLNDQVVRTSEAQDVTETESLRIFLFKVFGDSIKILLFVSKYFT